MPTLKILLISHELPPGKGATARILYKLFKLFQNDSYVVLTTPFHKILASDISLKLKLPCKYYYSVGVYPGTHYTKWIAIKEWLLVPLMIIKCLNTIRKEKVNKILVHPITGTFLLTAYLAHRITGIPLYLYMFDLFEEQMDKKSIRGIMAGPVERLTMRTATNVFVMSERLQEHYLKIYNRSTVLLPHPIDLKDNVVIQQEKEVKSESQYKIVLTSGMIYDAHFDAIINLIRAIRGMPEIEFHIYTRNADYLQRLGIDGANVIYKGYVDSIKISTIQREADILFLPMAFNSPNYKEIIKTASPGKLPEYLVSGTPILVHAPPYAYISWYARKNGWGLVVYKPDSRLLKEAVLKLICDKILQQGLINNAHKTALFHDINRVVWVFKKGLEIV